jgi:hypothetical protein
LGVLLVIQSNLYVLKMTYVDIGDLEFTLGNIRDTQIMITYIWCLIGISIFINIIQIILILQRSHLQPLKGRGKHILILLFFGQTFVFYLLNIRLTQRENFPCFIYTLIQFLCIYSKLLIHISYINAL